MAFTHYSRNRWTAFGTKNAQDWVELELLAPQRVGSVELYLWGSGENVKAPRRFVVEYWDGNAWAAARVLSQVPAIPQVSSINTVHIAPVMTGKVRVVFEHDIPAASGVTEIMIWSPE